MRVAFFQGCTVPVRNLNYELSARKVAEKIGLELVDIDQFQCCGFPMKSLSVEDSLVLAGRNLALAQQEGLAIVTLCSACGATLGEAAHQLDHDDELRGRVNERLAEIGLVYEPGLKVYHFIRYLVTEIGLETIADHVTRPLEGYSFVPHYGCHYLKPSEVTEKFDDPQDPKTLHKLIGLTGAEPIFLDGLAGCCGGGLLGTSEELANALALERLTPARDSGADGLVLICPFCNVMLEGQQKKIAKAIGDKKLKVPIFFYPQILGLAMGFSPDELGFKLNRVKNKALVKAFQPEK